MQIQEVSLPTSTPPLAVLSQENFARGVITLIDESKLPKNSLKEANNIMLAEDGMPKPRWGINWYGVAPSASALDGAAFYSTSAEASHLVAVAGGTIYRSVDDGATWDTCTGATLTSGHKVYFEQAATYLYLVNGQDNIVRYDGSTTLQSYTALTTPDAPTLAKTGLGATTYSYNYKYAAVNEVGFTIASNPAASPIQVSMTRDRWDISNYVTVTGTAVTNADRYDWYVSDLGGEYVYLASTTSPTYVDNGQDIENTNIIAPSANTTAGPKVGDITYVGSRLWATRDKDNPYRVWWTGSGAYIGYFSTSYDGGYIDLQKGSQFRPVKVQDYRDGKGTPLATVWCKSHDGRGCIWQIALESLTVADATFTVPAAYKLPGSRGTNAPSSVVNVLNDFFYYNSQAIYNLGSRAQFLNLLSTDEASSNIRPSVKEITATASDKIAGIYFDAKLFMSVPYGTSTNSHTIVYDTERKAWLPKAFTRGFERFFQYADTSGNLRLLAWKPGDTRLTQISSQIQGDYGSAFETSLVTGLTYVSKNRFEFMWVEEGEIEFSQPRGRINIELAGIERSAGFRSVQTTSIEPRTTNVGWDSAFWDALFWDDTTTVPDTFSESSLKRYFPVQRELNAYQWRVTTNSLDADYVLRTLQINGTLTQSGKPRAWRL